MSGIHVSCFCKDIVTVIYYTNFHWLPFREPLHALRVGSPFQELTRKSPSLASL